MHQNTSKRGLTLLITLLLMSVLLGISASILNVTLRQYQLSGIARASEMAFQAAQAGTECMMYNDIQNGYFDIDPTGGSIAELGAGVFDCMGVASPSDSEPVNNTRVSGDEQRFRFEWSGVCTEVSIYKFSKNDDGIANNDPDMASVLGVPSSAATKCPEGSVGAPVECTIIKSRGYNTVCGDLSNPRTVEREITQRY